MSRWFGSGLLNQEQLHSMVAPSEVPDFPDNCPTLQALTDVEMHMSAQFDELVNRCTLDLSSINCRSHNNQRDAVPIHSTCSSDAEAFYVHLSSDIAHVHMMDFRMSFNAAVVLRRSDLIEELALIAAYAEELTKFKALYGTTVSEIVQHTQLAAVTGVIPYIRKPSYGRHQKPYVLEV